MVYDPYSQLELKSNDFSNGVLLIQDLFFVMSCTDSSTWWHTNQTVPQGMRAQINNQVKADCDNNYHGTLIITSFELECVIQYAYYQSVWNKNVLILFISSKAWHILCTIDEVTILVL